MVAKTCYFGFKLVQSRRVFPLGKKTKQNNLLQQPSGHLQRQGAEASWPFQQPLRATPLRSPSCSSRPRWQGSGAVGALSWGEGDGAGRGRGRGAQPRTEGALRLAASSGVPALRLPRRFCRITADTGRPASTGIPDGDKSGAPGEAGWNRSG